MVAALRATDFSSLIFKASLAGRGEGLVERFKKIDVIWFDAKFFLPIDPCKKELLSSGLCGNFFLPVLLQGVRCSVLVVVTVS